jgi:hypothetical protein
LATVDHVFDGVEEKLAKHEIENQEVGPGEKHGEEIDTYK